nr:formyltransferase family protein [uncultured Flavobacterium sp.]
MSMQRDIVILCNNRMAFPAMQTLYGLNKLHTIGVPVGNDEVLSFCSPFASQTGVNLILLEKEKLENQLQGLLESSEINYVFTMTFPWKLSEKIIEQYPNLFYNFHYGLLPEMRGCDPVFESIRQQKQETGITVHTIEKEIDAGNIVLKRVLPIDANVTHGMLCTSLSYLGAQIVPEVVALLQTNFKGVPQDETDANYYKKAVSGDVCIRWETQDAKSIQALVNACNPWNKGAYTQWSGWNMRILEVSPTKNVTVHSHSPGTILEINENKGLIIQCYNNTQLRINTVYTDEGFMSGYKLLAFGIKNGEQFASL